MQQRCLTIFRNEKTFSENKRIRLRLLVASVRERERNIKRTKKKFTSKNVKRLSERRIRTSIPCSAHLFHLWHCCAIWVQELRISRAYFIWIVDSLGNFSLLIIENVRECVCVFICRLSFFFLSVASSSFRMRPMRVVSGEHIKNVCSNKMSCPNG